MKAIQLKRAAAAVAVIAGMVAIWKIVAAFMWACHNAGIPM